MHDILSPWDDVDHKKSDIQYETKDILPKQLFWIDILYQVKGFRCGWTG